MRLERVFSELHPMYRKTLELYKASFPYCERRSEAAQSKIMLCNDYNFCLIYDSQVFIGAVLFWETDIFIYIEHFFIHPEMRNKHYGSRVLNLLQGKNKKIILEIDLPQDDISTRRKGFYERCGFTENSYLHIQPLYHPSDKERKLIIMSYPGKISERDYINFYGYLKNRVMKDAF